MSEMTKDSEIHLETKVELLTKENQILKEGIKLRDSMIDNGKKQLKEKS